MDTSRQIDSSRVFAEFVAASAFEDLPPDAVANTKRSIFDTVGVMLAGGGRQANAHHIVRVLAGWGGTPSSTVIGHAVRLPAPQAAFANTAMAHQFDFDDVHDKAVAHPTGNSFGGALAAAEERGDVSGREFLAGVLLGNEITCRVGAAIKGALYDYVWIWPAVVSIWGATTAAARVMGLNADQIQSAYGLTLHQVGTTLQCHHGSGSDVRGFRDGFSARNGVTAAALAAAGLRGDPEAFDGTYGFYGAFFRGEYDRNALIEALGDVYEVNQISIKAWPSARETHATLQALIELQAKYGITADSIDRVLLHVGETNFKFCEPASEKRHPSRRMDALCALPFCSAVALIHGGVPLAAFSEESLRDGEVAELARRIQWILDDALSEGTVEGGDVEIVLKSGQRYRHAVRQGIGHPDCSISDDMLVRKFFDCAQLASRPVSAKKVRDFWDITQGIENISADEFSRNIRDLVE